MTETASLVIKVDSSGAKSASADLDRLTNASGKAERATDGLARAARVLAGVFTAAAVARVTSAYIDAADAAANMSAKLRLVTGSVESAARAQKALYDLSQRNSSDLEATTELYVKLGQSSAELADNSELLLSVTDKVSKALVISGADAASSAAVIRQFSQAMASGALRGDEFISVMEGAPRLARAIADGMGVAVGSLRTLAAEGKLTSETIISALENQGATLDREFGEMPLTVSRATQQVRNALMQLVGDTESSSGATRDLASAIADLARTLESEELKQGFANTVGGLNQIIQATLSASGYLDRLRGALAGLELQGNAAFQSLNPMNWTPGNLRRLEDQYRKGAAYAENGWSAMQPSATVGNAIPDGMRSGPRGRRTRATEAEVAATAGYGKTVSADLQKEIDKIREQAAAYGLSRLELAKLNQEKALAAATTDAERDAIRGAYGELIKRIQVSDAAAASSKAAKKADEEWLWHEEYATAARIDYSNKLIRAALEREEAEERATQQVRDLIDEMEFEASLIGLTNVEREKAIALRRVEGAATEEQKARIGELVEIQAKATDSMSEYAKQAARNMQTNFADFLFDPFKDGVSGMVQGFVDALRRMAAESAAAKIFDSIGAWGQANAGASGWMGMVAGFAGMLGGQRAAGGPLQAGQGYIVGDGGRPELFVPGQSGTLYTMGKGTGSQPPAPSLQVIVKNESGQQLQSQQSEMRFDGERWVAQVLLKTIASGGADGAMGRYGLTPRGYAGG